MTTRRRKTYVVQGHLVCKVQKRGHLRWETVIQLPTVPFDVVAVTKSGAVKKGRSYYRQHGKLKQTGYSSCKAVIHAEEV